MNYGKCERCGALAQLRPVGTLDPDKGTTVKKLCAQCEPLYIHLNRQQRRDLTKLATHTVKAPKKPPDNATLMRIRKKAQEKKPSPILVPEEKPIAPETPKSPILLPPEKGGLILP